MQNFGTSILCYCIAYLIVTLIGMLHTILNIYAFHMKSMKNSPGMGEAYEKTKPWHPLYNLLVFPLFAGIYLNSLSVLDYQSVLATSLLWGTLTIIIDLIGWVLIRHPWSLTFRQFYIEYQPWITLIYLAIYASPFIAYIALSI